MEKDKNTPPPQAKDWPERLYDREAVKEFLRQYLDKLAAMTEYDENGEQHGGEPEKKFRKYFDEPIHDREDTNTYLQNWINDFEAGYNDSTDKLAMIEKELNKSPATKYGNRSMGNKFLGEGNEDKMVNKYLKYGYDLAIDGKGKQFSNIDFLLYDNNGTVRTDSQSDHGISGMSYLNMGCLVTGYARALFEKYLKEKKQQLESGGDATGEEKGLPKKVRYLLMREYGLLDSEKFNKLSNAQKGLLLSMIWGYDSDTSAEKIRQELSEIKYFTNKTNTELLNECIGKIVTYKQPKKSKGK